MDRFTACLSEILDSEGGYANRSAAADPGGPTNCGVTWQTYNRYREVKGLPIRDVQLIEPHEVRDIYWGQYWLAAGCDKLPAGLDLAVFDFAVNSGPVTAIRHLQRALGVRVDGHYGLETYGAIRNTYLPHLIVGYVEVRRTFGRSLKNYPHNKNGWETRWRRVEASALRACGVAAWAAQVAPEPGEVDHEAYHAEQGRAVARDPSPPVANELMLGGGGVGGLSFAIPNAIQRSLVGGRFSASAFALAVLTEPLFWGALLTLWGAFATYRWRKAHAR